jgi:hypothetical protein
MRSRTNRAGPDPRPLYLVTVVAVIVSNLARAADRGGPIRTASMLGEKAVRASVYSGASTSSRQKA